MNIQWSYRGGTYFPTEISQNKKIIPQGVYVLNDHGMAGLGLDPLQDKFSFPFKIYGTETELIRRVLRTYKSTKTNLGVLLNGVKGTGKTVTAQQICNDLALPVILINRDFDGLVGFLSQIQQDVVVFFDEFEKSFPADYRHGSKLLTVMDGAMKTDFRRLFMLTTNTLYLDDNLLQRPGRIRYVKTFGNLSLEHIIEIIDDKLEHLQFRTELIQFIAELETITVDIISSIIQEVNIHEEPPAAFASVFNVKKTSKKYDIYETSYTEGIPVEKKIQEGMRVTPAEFDEDSIGTWIRVGNDTTWGRILAVVSEKIATVELEADDDDETKKIITIRVEPVQSAYHGLMQYL